MSRLPDPALYCINEGNHSSFQNFATVAGDKRVLLQVRLVLFVAGVREAAASSETG